jgi:hypothetical protein
MSPSDGKTAFLSLKVDTKGRCGSFPSDSFKTVRK